MSIFNHIKQRLSITDVIGEYVTLKKAGQYYKGCCPFHPEKTASFTISPHKDIFYCFGCQAGGDVVSFISRIEQCNQLEAARLLAERYQLELPSDLPSNISSDRKKQYFHIVELVADWCHELLLKSPAVMRYLFGRGLDITCIKKYKIGYFPSGFATVKALTKYMAEQHILAADLLEANILHKGKAFFYSPFEERIIFPITDHLGHYCGFGGRIYKKDDTRAKYYNSQENEFFNKGSLLYGLSLAKESMQKQNIAFLVEGYTDCIAMAQHGYTNSVATLGTACTHEHLKLLARYVEQVYVVYDNDRAGQQAILRLAELCWQANLELKVICLPEGEDPASYLKHKLNLSEKIKEAQDIFHFFIRMVGRDFAHKPLNQKLTASRKITALIANISDNLKRDILLQEAAKALEIPFQALKDDLKKPKYLSTAGTAPAPTEQHETIEQKALLRLPKLEKKILAAILNNVSLLRTQYRSGIYLLLPDSFTEILKKLETTLGDRTEYAISELFAVLTPEELQLASQILLDDDMQHEDFDYLFNQMQKKYWKSAVNDIKIKLEQARQQGDVATCAQLVQKFTALKQMMLEKNIQR